MENLQSSTEYLATHDLTVVTAESCTAGLIAGMLADMPGCGQWFKSGYVTYSPEAKSRILGVSQDTIAQFNLTSEQVAREMALGALSISEANIAVANTGVAGPTNGEGDIPAGTVCFAWAFRCNDKTIVTSETRHFDGDRNRVRQSAAEYAISKIPALHQACNAGMQEYSSSSQSR